MNEDHEDREDHELLCCTYDRAKPSSSSEPTEPNHQIVDTL